MSAKYGSIERLKTDVLTQVMKTQAKKNRNQKRQKRDK